MPSSRTDVVQFNNFVTNKKSAIIHAKIVAVVTQIFSYQLLDFLGNQETSDCYTYQHNEVLVYLNLIHHFTLLLVLIDVEKLHTSDALFSTN